MDGGLQILPKSPVQMRELLVAQLRWERYRSSRLLLVHALAACALLAWIPLPVWLRPALGAASAACFLGTLFAGMMERHWGRERDRRAAVPPDAGGKD